MKKNKCTKRKKIIVIIAILLILLVIFKIAMPKENEEETIETEEIQKRDIAQSISATGIISTSDTKTVVGKLTGTEIKTVNITEGQRISVGDVICTFDTSDLQEDLAIAQTSKALSNAQANLGVQGAQRSLDDASKARDKQLNDLQNTVNGANSNLKTAQTSLENANLELNTLNSTLENLKSQKKILEDKISSINNPPVVDDVSGIGDVSNSTNNADLVLGESLADLETQLGQIEVQINTTNNQISETKNKIVGLQNSIFAAQTAYNQAVDAYNSAKDTLDSQIASLQDQVKNSQISTSLTDTNSKTQLKTLQDQIENGVIKSTVNGTVTQVNIKAGDIYTGSTIAVIEGCEDFIVEAEIDEYDIPDISVGMRVLIKTDATRDEELEGRVIYTAPSATTASTSSSMGAASSSATSGSSATYTVKISLDTPNDRLRLGMNAKLSIITESKEDVWSVPYDAVYDREDGTHYIEILKNEETEEIQEITVEKGLEGTYYVEISSDELKEGMRVVLPKIEAGNSMKELIEMMGADAGL